MPLTHSLSPVLTVGALGGGDLGAEGSRAGVTGGAGAFAGGVGVLSIGWFNNKFSTSSLS